MKDSKNMMRTGMPWSFQQWLRCTVPGTISAQNELTVCASPCVSNVNNKESDFPYQGSELSSTTSWFGASASTAVAGTAAGLLSGSPKLGCV
ncbi:hypothetical protein BaRGS_00021267 [Batillaria attramentaria]|uniref:Uncharacterized protein n=1 Tax=Batillaria attramentaria TaxID=370345 RepID=A0ABD0KKQ6_9CAEN